MHINKNIFSSSFVQDCSFAVMLFVGLAGANALIGSESNSNNGPSLHDVTKRIITGYFHRQQKEPPSESVCAKVFV